MNIVVIAATLMTLILFQHGYASSKESCENAQHEVRWVVHAIIGAALVASVWVIALVFSMASTWVLRVFT